MSTWTARRLAWAIGIFSLVLMMATLVLMFAARGTPGLPSNALAWSTADILDVVSSVGVPVLGIVIVTRQPKNAVGWLFLAAGLSLALAMFGEAYAVRALLIEPGSLPGGEALGWLGNVLWSVPVSGLILLFLLFPTGHVVSARWRIVVWVTLGLSVVLLLGSVILATSIWSTPFVDIPDVETGVWSDAALVAIVIAGLAWLVGGKPKEPPIRVIVSYVDHENYIDTNGRYVVCPVGSDDFDRADSENLGGDWVASESK